MNTTSLVLQISGHEVVTIPTVLYSNHLSLPTFGGGIIPDELFSSVLDGILQPGILHNVSAILTGFIGSALQVKLAAGFIRTLKNQNPEIRYLCDPVMGDTDKGQYVPADIPEAILTHLVPLADLLTPNQFEATRMLQHTTAAAEDIIGQLRQRFDLQRQKVVITSYEFDQPERDFVYKCAVAGNSSEIIKTRKINLHPAGTGELFTAHLHRSMLRAVNFTEAVQLAGDTVSATLEKMFSENRTEFELQDILFSMNVSSNL